MTSVGRTIRAAGLGALGMYFFDPEVGRRRQALVRDQFVHWLSAVRAELETDVRDAGNRARGVVAAFRRIGNGADESDAAVAARVRAHLGALERPAAVVVEVRDGRVHLRGAVLPRDAERARRAVRHVRGARELVDEMEEREDATYPRREPRGFGDFDPATRLAAGALTAVVLSPVVRLLGPRRVLRLVALAALAAAVTSTERARAG